MTLRVASPLSEDLENLAHDVIGSAIEVHRALGPGLLEAIYGRALVAGRLIVEVKSVERLDSIHVAQVLSYLQAAKLRLGLLINFNQYTLKDGIRRVIL